MWLFLIHPTVSKTLFQLFNCTHIGGKPSLVESLSQECWTGTHLAIVGSIGALGLAAWVIGLPLGTGLVLREKAALLENKAIKQRLGFLYSGFARRAYFWEVLIMARKEAVAAIGTFLVGEGTSVQALLLLVLLGVSVLLHLRVRPYATPLLNTLETLSLASLVVSVVAGLFFLGDRDPATPFYRPGVDFSLSAPFRWLLFFAIVVPNFAFFLRLTAELLRHTRSILRERSPRCYLACCLCFNRRLFRDEQRDAGHQQASVTVVKQIEFVISDNYI